MSDVRPFDRAAAHHQVGQGRLPTISAPRAARFIQHAVLVALISAADENGYVLGASTNDLHASHGLDDRAVAAALGALTAARLVEVRDLGKGRGRAIRILWPFPAAAEPTAEQRRVPPYGDTSGGRSLPPSSDGSRHMATLSALDQVRPEATQASPNGDTARPAAAGVGPPDAPISAQSVAEMPAAGGVGGDPLSISDERSQASQISAVGVLETRVRANEVWSANTHTEGALVEVCGGNQTAVGVVQYLAAQPPPVCWIATPTWGQRWSASAMTTKVTLDDIRAAICAAQMVLGELANVRQDDERGLGLVAEHIGRHARWAHKPEYRAGSEVPRVPDWLVKKFLERWRQEYKRVFGVEYIVDEADRESAARTIHLARGEAREEARRRDEVATDEDVDQRSREIAKHWIRGYLADQARWIIEHAHRLKHLWKQIGPYGLPPRQKAPNEPVANAPRGPGLRAVPAPAKLPTDEWAKLRAGDFSGAAGATGARRSG